MCPFLLKTASIPADILVRLRSNLCLWGEPEAYSGKGRPKKHGPKFKLSEPTTWSDAESVLELDDPKLQRVRVSLWKNLHFRKAAARTMLLLRVERLNAQGNKRRVKTFVVGSLKKAARDLIDLRMPLLPLIPRSMSKPSFCATRCTKDSD